MNKNVLILNVRSSMNQVDTIIAEAEKLGLDKAELEKAKAGAATLRMDLNVLLGATRRREQL